MTSEGLGEMFEGESADMCTGKFLLMSMEGCANRQACADGERGEQNSNTYSLLFIISEPPEPAISVSPFPSALTLLLCLSSLFIMVFMAYKQIL